MKTSTGSDKLTISTDDYNSLVSRIAELETIVERNFGDIRTYDDTYSLSQGSTFLGEKSYNFKISTPATALYIGYALATFSIAIDSFPRSDDQVQIGFYGDDGHTIIDGTRVQTYSVENKGIMIQSSCILDRSYNYYAPYIYFTSPSPVDVKCYLRCKQIWIQIS